MKNYCLDHFGKKGAYFTYFRKRDGPQTES